MDNEYNHNRPLSDFEDSLKIIREHGFNPIAVTQMFFEDAFVFETSDEATKAYHTLEVSEDNTIIGKVQGWWYCRDEFNKIVKEYEKNIKYSSKVLIHWLNE